MARYSNTQLRYIMIAKKPGERIKNRRQALGLTQTELAKLCGWGDSHVRIARYENHNRKLPGEEAKILAENLNTTPEWLMFGTGEEDLMIAEKEKGLKIIGGCIGYIPIINWDEVETFCEVFDSMEQSKESLEKKWKMVPIFVPLGERCFALEIKDTAMTSPQGGKDSFYPGNMIFVDPDQKHKNGSYVIVVMANGEEAAIKKYTIQGGKEDLVSLNPAYRTIEFTRGMSIKGKVIANTTFFE
jgi:SOS-response transcriptional repressor LexA